MTSIDVRGRKADTHRPRADERQRKDVLFCPVCGHESPVDGTWVVVSTESQREFRCPDCEQVVAVR